MNKNLVFFIFFTKLQSFIASIYNFGFLLIFYKITNNAFSSGLLFAVSNIITRLFSFFMVPKLKNQNPIKISSYTNFILFIFSLLMAFLHNFFGESLFYYFLLHSIILTLEELDNTFQYPVVPLLINKKSLYKVNSINAMITNVITIISPIFAYIFSKNIAFPIFLVFFGLINLVSSLALSRINILNWINQYTKPTIKSEWKKTLKLISNTPELFSCILTALFINFLFSGLGNTFILIAGTTELERTIIKILISIGSFSGIFLVYKLNLKENYKSLLFYSFISLEVCLFFLILAKSYISYFFICILSLLIMFIMNSTGTKLQLAAKPEDLALIYSLRATLLSFVIPISQMTSGAILEYFGTPYYFIFCFIVLLILLVTNKLLSKKSKYTLSFKN